MPTVCALLSTNTRTMSRMSRVLQTPTIFLGELIKAPLRLMRFVSTTNASLLPISLDTLLLLNLFFMLWWIVLVSDLSGSKILMLVLLMRLESPRFLTYVHGSSIMLLKWIFPKQQLNLFLLPSSTQLIKASCYLMHGVQLGHLSVMICAKN